MRCLGVYDKRTASLRAIQTQRTAYAGDAGHFSDDSAASNGLCPRCALARH